MAPSSEVICILSDDEDGAPPSGRRLPPAKAGAQPAEVINLATSSDECEGRLQARQLPVATPHRQRRLLTIRQKQQRQRQGGEEGHPVCTSAPDPGFEVLLSKAEGPDSYQQRRPSASPAAGASPVAPPSQPQEEGAGGSGSDPRRHLQQQALSSKLRVGIPAQGRGQKTGSQSPQVLQGSASKPAQQPGSWAKHAAVVLFPPVTRLPPFLLKLRRQSPPAGEQPLGMSVAQQRGAGQGEQGQTTTLGSKRALQTQQKASEAAKQQSRSNSSPAQISPADPPPAGQAWHSQMAQNQRQQHVPAGERETKSLPAQPTFRAAGPGAGSRWPSVVGAGVSAAAGNGNSSSLARRARECTPSGALVQEQYVRPLPSHSCLEAALVGGGAPGPGAQAAACDGLAASHPAGVTPPATYGHCPALATAAQPASVDVSEDHAMEMDPPLAALHRALPSTSAGVTATAGGAVEAGGSRQLRKRKPKEEQAYLQGFAKRLRPREASTQQRLWVGLPAWAHREGAAPNVTPLLLAAAAQQPPCPWRIPGVSGPGSSNGRPVPGWVALQQVARCPGFHSCRGPEELQQLLLDFGPPSLGLQQAGAASAAQRGTAGTAAAAWEKQPGAAGPCQGGQQARSGAREASWAGMSMPEAYNRLLASAVASAGTAPMAQPSPLAQLHRSLALPPVAIVRQLKTAFMAEGPLLAELALAIAAAAARRPPLPLPRGRPLKHPRGAQEGPPGPSLLGRRPAAAEAAPSAVTAAAAAGGGPGGAPSKKNSQVAGQVAPVCKLQGSEAPARGKQPKCPPKSSMTRDAAAAVPASPEQWMPRLGAGFSGPREQRRDGVAGAKGGARGVAKGRKAASLKQLAKRKDIQSFHPLVPPLCHLPRQYNS